MVVARTLGESIITKTQAAELENASGEQQNIRQRSAETVCVLPTDKPGINRRVVLIDRRPTDWPIVRKLMREAVTRGASRERVNVSGHGA